MKNKILVTLSILMSLGLSSFAKAGDDVPLINCQVWTLTLDTAAVPQDAEANAVNLILSMGQDFGFYVESRSAQGATHYVDLKYDRDSIVGSDVRQTAYNKLIGDYNWHLNHRYGYNFDCSLSYGGPRPRISGTN